MATDPTISKSPGGGYFTVGLEPGYEDIDWLLLLFLLETLCYPQPGDHDDQYDVSEFFHLLGRRDITRARSEMLLLTIRMAARWRRDASSLSFSERSPEGRLLSALQSWAGSVLAGMRVEHVPQCAVAVGENAASSAPTSLSE